MQRNRRNIRGEWNKSLLRAIRVKSLFSRSPISNREKERETAIETPVFQERAK